MTTMTKRTTIYLEPPLHRALRLKSAEAGISVSSLINDMVRNGLREDIDDIKTIRERAEEPTISYEALLEDLRAHGKI